MTRLALSLAAVLLAGCAADPMIPDSDVIRIANEPAYGYDENGRLAATSCRSDRPSTYSGTPSACQRDVVFARQVANPADLVRPQVAGRAMAAPVGAAADRYLSGGAPAIPYAVTTTTTGGNPYGAMPVPTDAYYGR